MVTDTLTKNGSATNSARCSHNWHGNFDGDFVTLYLNKAFFSGHMESTVSLLSSTPKIIRNRLVIGFVKRKVDTQFSKC